MVRLYTRLIKKRYLHQKRVYAHRHIALPIPAKYHDLVQPFLDHDLTIHVAAHPNRLIVTLLSKPDTRETPSSRRTPPGKNPPNNPVETA